MLKRNKELKFSKDDLKIQADGKLWFDQDLLNRGPHVRAITDLLLKTDGNFVMTTSSPWGTGKTTFMRMWKAWLEHAGHPCVLFNAWENDYIDNPFLTFIAEMHEQLYALQGPGRKQRRHALTKLKTAGKKLFPKILSLGVKTGLGVSIDFEKIGKKLFNDKEFDLSKLGEGLTQIMGDSMEAYASDALESHTTTKKLKEDFKTQLKTVVKNLNSNQKMFFFVDELDRCKPTYAVELLEVIKHLFDVEGIIFVLSLDREQLGHSVRSAYGEGIDSDGYLRRFIDLEYRIPEPTVDHFVKHLGQMYGIENSPCFGDKPEVIYEEFINEFAIASKELPLRTIEKAFLRGTILLQGFPQTAWHFPSQGFVTLILLREISSEVYDLVLAGSEWDSIKNKYNEKLPKLNQINGGAAQALARGKMWLNYRLKNKNLGRMPKDQGILMTAFSTCHTQHHEHLIDIATRYLDLSESLIN
ncbi:P-loop NTPase fold protein [Maridesulfovibrio sp.]|uniref:KAP family P-loop NTPase fold protein n=1 Tax=Maridesulfovibrio sp. TaxID=2795000 RepID=UPI0039EEFE9E